MAKIAGLAFIKVDGVNYSSNGEFTASIQNKKFTEIVDADGNMHHSEATQASTISGALYTTPELDPQVLVDATDVVIQIEFKNGKTALLKDAIYTGSAEVSSKDGSFSVEFKGVGSWI